MSNVYSSVWAGRSDLTPSFVKWEFADGSSAGTPPTISLVSSGSDRYKFVPLSIPADIFAKMDSGDTTMLDPDERYRYFTVRPSDGQITFVQTPIGLYSCNARIETDAHQGVGLAVLLVFAGDNPLPTYTITVGLDGNTPTNFSLNAGTYKFRAIQAGYTFADVIQEIDSATTITITGTGVIIPTPTAGYQIVSFGIQGSGQNDSATGAIITAVPQPSQEVAGFTLNLPTQTTETINGIAYIGLAQGYQYLVTEKWLSGEIISKLITITEDTSKTFGSYVDERKSSPS